MRTWILTGLISATLLVVITLALYLTPYLHAIDAAVLEALKPAQTFGVIGFFLGVTVLGSGVGIILVAIGFAYISRLSTILVLRLTGLLTAVLLLNRLLKDLVARARPDTLHWFDTLPSYSYPSAHATAVIALYGFIMVRMYRKGYRWLLLVPTTTILLVGGSRMVLSVHHLSDVVAGYLLGLALLSLAIVFPPTTVPKAWMSRRLAG